VYQIMFLYNERERGEVFIATDEEHATSIFKEKRPDVTITSITKVRNV
jgi:hypothetical protein